MDATAKSDVALAGARIPERQREALELHERDGLSYDEIAARLETSWSSVAQLIAHARINFYDELRGTILASMAPSSDCERAPSLIAARQDGELDPDSAEAAWLDAHLAECQRCERGVEEMRAASAAYRGSAPAADGPRDSSAPAPRRRLALALTAAALLLFAGVATAFVRNGSSSAPAEPAVEVADRSKPAARGAATEGKGGGKASQRKGSSKAVDKKAASSDATGAAAPPPTVPPTSEVPVAVPGADEPVSGGGGGGGGGGGSASGPSGDTAVDPPQRTAAPKAKPAPTATSSPPSPPPAPAPAPVSAPPAESPPPEEPAEETSRRREPPGKPAHAGPK